MQIEYLRNMKGKKEPSTKNLLLKKELHIHGVFITASTTSPKDICFPDELWPPTDLPVSTTDVAVTPLLLEFLGVGEITFGGGGGVGGSYLKIRCKYVQCTVFTK